MKKRIVKTTIWSEFTTEMAGWVVGLNTTGFHHIGLLQDYARAYRKAAQRLFEVLRQTLVDEDRFDDHRDMDAHPIAFLYRHAVEVYLKTIIVFGNNLLRVYGKPMKADKDIYTSHKLVALLPNVKEVFSLINCSDLWIVPDFQSFADIERVVKALDQVKYDALRYPVGTAKGKLVEMLPGGLHFDVLAFAEKLDALLSLLDGASKRTWDTFQELGRNEYLKSAR